MRPVFPFTAIVGQERMKSALLLNAVNPLIGGVLIRGERGTAKSTAARALAALLPDVNVVVDCHFGCDPEQPSQFCTECRERASNNGNLSGALRRTAFVDLPISATEDRVVGTLDIEKAIQKGERHFEPGILASANRGLLYIDEVNLLDDHVVDLLLDSAAMGVNVVEREGISFTHPSKFILVGTMNPEEGDLRPQLLDRFALSATVRGISDSDARVDIMVRNIAFETDPDAFSQEWQPKEQFVSSEIAAARKLLPDVTYSRFDLESIAELTTSLEVDGHRADLVILRAARAHAAFKGRAQIENSDILLAAELALPHRVKKGPFQRSEMVLQDLEERLEQARSDAASGEQGEPKQSDETAQVKKKIV